MRIFARRRDAPGDVAAPRTATLDGGAAAPQPAAFDGDDDALTDHIDRLHERARATRDPAAQRELLALRHLAGVRALRRAPARPAFPEATDPPPGPGMPELPASELTAGRLRAAVLDAGGVIVRGLVGRERALAFADGIDRAFAQRDRHDAGGDGDPALYAEFGGVPGEALGRPWIKAGGGVLAADSPALHFEMVDMFREAGVPELVAAYLGEPGLITVQKTTLRMADPSVAGNWHQDGKFMGPVRALNLWLALSRCGDVAPGLDVVPRRLEGHVPTTSDEPPLHYLVSPQVAARAAGERGVQRPIFEPGDAMLFDELFLHQTAADPAMAHPRYAIENWFFGASGFPGDYAPLAV